MNRYGTPTRFAGAARLRTLAVALVAAGALPSTATAQSGTWSHATAGTFNWSDATRWTGGVVADGANNAANFTTAGLTGNMRVTLDTPRTIGSLVFDNPTNAFGWSILGTNTLTLSNTGGPSIAVNNAGISAALPIPLASTQGLTKTGPGTLVLSAANAITGGVTVSGGVLNAAAAGSLGTGDVNITGGTVVVGGVSGFGSSGAGWTTNGTATFPVPNALQLTPAAGNAAGSIWYNTLVPTGPFTLGFTYSSSASSATPADGFTVGFQNAGPTALGAAGGALGYQNITPSVALAVNVFPNNTIGATGSGIKVITNGAAPGNNYTATTPVSAALLNNPTDVSIAFDGTNAVVTMTQGANTFTSAPLPFNIGAALGPTALFGFTGGTGGSFAQQQISNFSLGTSGVITGRVNISAAGTLSVQGNTTIGSLAGTAGTVNNNSRAAARLTVGSDNTSTSFGGTIINGSTGPLALTKVGTGTLTLTGTNTYSGGTVVNDGTLAVASDTALGTGPVAIGAFGNLTYTAATTTSKTFALGGGTLAAAGGQSVTLAGSQVFGGITGGYLGGAGTFATSAASAARFANVTTHSTVTIASNSPSDQYLNFINGGTLNVASGLATPVSMSGFTNAGSGTVNVGAGSQVNASNFQSYGQLVLAPGTQAAPTVLTNVGASDVFLNGGSRTFVGTNTAGSVAKMDLGGRNLVVAGGLLVNNGGALATGGGIRNGTVIVDYGGRAKGTGLYEDIITQNGGVYSPGNSPGTGRLGTARVHPGGRFNMDMDRAGGPGGSAPGWGMIEAVSALRIYAEPMAKQVISVTSQSEGGSGLAGPVADFDATRSYSWEFIRMDPLAELFTTQAGGTAVDPSTYAYDPSIVGIDTSGFLNATQGGVFSTSFGPNGAGSYSLFVTFSPVPEPGTLALTAVAGAGMGWVVRRRRANRAAESA